MFFSQLVLPRVGAPRVTFVTKTAVKCMRPHSLGDSSSTEFLSHFPSAGRRVQGPSRPAFLVLSSPRVLGGYAFGVTQNPFPSRVVVVVVVAKILTPLRGDTTALLVRPKSLSIPRKTKTAPSRKGAPEGPLRRAYSSSERALPRRIKDRRRFARSFAHRCNRLGIRAPRIFIKYLRRVPLFTGSVIIVTS